MTVLLAQITLEPSTHMPEDRFVNTFHFITNDPAASMIGIRNALNEFYASDTEQVTNQQVAGERAIINYFGPQIDPGNLHTGKLYDLADAKPRQPILEWNPNLVEIGDTSFPAEVAVCCSYYADSESGDNEARRRGRVFLGPLAAVSATQGLDDARVNPAFAQVIAKAATRLANSTGWCIYSPTTDNEGATLDESAYLVSGGWVDNAFDTQRRRGMRATSRVMWNLADLP
jgi:hypothetical protein